MIKRIIIICLIAALAYYAGIQGLAPENIADWFEESNIIQTLQNAFYKILELAEEEQVVEKAGDVIEKVKEKISD